MARYLGPGDGEGLPLSRRGSSLRPAGPGALLAPRPEASGPGRPLLRAAPLPARAGPPPSSRAAPRQGRGRGCPSHGAPGSPHALPPPGRPRSRGEGGKGASGGQRAATNAGSATRAAPLPQRRWRRRRPGPCCCCQLVGRTLSMRARRPHPGNFRVWPFSPPRPALLSFLSPPPPRTPAGVTGRVALRRRRGPRRRRGAPNPAWSRPGRGRYPQRSGERLLLGVLLPQSAQTARESSACCLYNCHLQTGDPWLYEDFPRPVLRCSFPDASPACVLWSKIAQLGTSLAIQWLSLQDTGSIAEDTSQAQKEVSKKF